MRAQFDGIIRAIKDYASLLRAHNVAIWVRRGGPNYRMGLRRMHDVGRELGLEMHVFGPEVHMTAIVPMALGVADPLKLPEFDASKDVAPWGEDAQIAGVRAEDEFLRTMVYLTL